MKLIPKLLLSTFLACSGLPVPNPSSAADLVSLRSGQAVIDYDRTAWEALAADIGLSRPVLTLDTFFNADQAAAADYEAILHGPGGEARYLQQIYLMNGPSPINLTGRTAQSTDFLFNPDQPTNHLGKIGLGGITRFNVSGGGHLLFGDFTLQFDPSRIRRGGGGWVLRGNIPPVAPVFDLLNPRSQVNPTTGEWSLEGDLGVTFEIAQFLFNTPSDALRSVGRMRFTAEFESETLQEFRLVGISIAPDQSNLRIGVEGGKANRRFRLLQSSDPNQPLNDWSVAAEGDCDAEGKSEVIVTLTSRSASWFFRGEGVGW